MPRRRIIQLCVSCSALALIAIAAAVGGVAGKGSPSSTGTGNVSTTPPQLTIELPSRVPTMPDGFTGVAYIASATSIAVPGYAVNDTAGTRIQALIPRGAIILDTKPLDTKWQKVRLDTALGLGALQKKFDGKTFIVARSQLVPISDARSNSPQVCPHWSSWIVNRRNFPSVDISERADTHAPLIAFNTLARHLWLTCTTAIADATISPGASIPSGTQMYEVVDSGRDIQGVHRAFLAGQPNNTRDFWKLMDPADTTNVLQPELIVPTEVPTLPVQYRGVAYIASTTNTVFASTLDNGATRQLPRGLILNTQPLDETWQQVQTFGGWAKIKRSDLVPIPKKCANNEAVDNWFAYTDNQSSNTMFQLWNYPISDTETTSDNVTAPSLGLRCLRVIPSASVPAGSTIPDNAMMYERVHHPVKSLKGSALVSGDLFYPAFTYGNRSSAVESGTWQLIDHNHEAAWKRP